MLTDGRMTTKKLLIPKTVPFNCENIRYKGIINAAKEPSSIAVEYWKLGLSFTLINLKSISCHWRNQQCKHSGHQSDHRWIPKGTSKFSSLENKFENWWSSYCQSLFSRCDIHGCIRHSQNHPDKGKMEINDRMLNAVYFNTDPIVERSSNACFDVGAFDCFFLPYFHRLSPPTFVWIIDNITIKETITKETAAAYPKLGVNL